MLLKLNQACEKFSTRLRPARILTVYQILVAVDILLDAPDILDREVLAIVGVHFVLEDSLAGLNSFHKAYLLLGVKPEPS